VKPQLGSRGRHTTTHIYTKEDLLKAYRIAKQLCHFVIVEEHLFGSVYRATYVGGEIVGILRGDPPRITGDSVHTIKELIAIKNENKKNLVKDVQITDGLVEFIGRQNLTLDTVLESGRTIDLSEKIGISYGGFAAEEFPTTHLKLLSYLKKAGDFLKAPVVGFDFIIEDAKADPDTQRWGIIEANSLPFINLHHFPLEGDPINVAGKVWDLWKK
jgi:cyanophycin synthetase